MKINVIKVIQSGETFYAFYEEDNTGHLNPSKNFYVLAKKMIESYPNDFNNNNPDNLEISYPTERVDRLYPQLGKDPVLATGLSDKEVVNFHDELTKAWRDRWDKLKKK